MFSDFNDSVLKHSVIFIKAVKTLYSIISELNNANNVILNHSRHYSHQNLNRNNNENSDVKSLKVLISTHKSLKEILYLTFIIQSSNTSSIYDCSKTFQQLAKIILLMSNFFSVIVTEAVHNNNNFLDLFAERFIKTDNQKLYVDYNNNEELNNKLSTEQMLFSFS